MRTLFPRDSRALFGVIAVLLGFSACARGGSSRTAPRALGPRTTAFAAAALNIGPDDLGRPFDAYFRPITGREGAPLISNDEDDLRVTQLNRMEHAFFSVDDTRALAANASAWGLPFARVVAGAGAASQDRFACFRAYQIVEVREVDDTVALRHVPPGAAYYLARIYYGHLYETVFVGDQRSFHAGVRADLPGASGGIEAWASRRGLRTQVRGVGMSPRDDAAIFATTAAEVEAHYRTSPEPVPIFVEYVSVPGALIPAPQEVAWLQPTTVNVALTQLDVYSDGAAFSAAWNLDVQCSVNGAQVPDSSGIPLFRHHRVNDRRRSGRAATYPLQWSRDFEVFEGDDLRCAVSGRVDRALGLLGGRQVPPSQFAYRVQSTPSALSHLFGTGDGRVEYRIHYRVAARD